MTFALVLDDEIQAVGRLPGSARLVETGQWFCPPGGLKNATTAEQEACGWFAVIDAPPTFDEATEALERGDVELVAGVPTRAYTKRAKTAEELAAEADDADRNTKGVTVAQAIPWLRQQAETARGVTVTSTNAVAVLGGLVKNVGQFYDHFADFLEARRFDQTAGNGEP